LLLSKHIYRTHDSILKLAQGKPSVFDAVHEGWLRGYQKAASECYTKAEVTAALTALQAQEGNDVATGDANYVAAWLMAGERGQTETAEELWSRSTTGARRTTVSLGSYLGGSLSSQTDVRWQIPKFYGRTLLQILQIIIVVRVRVRVRVYRALRRGV
jgi:hypothetical protein